MRTLKVSVWASVIGWVVSLVAGNVVGVLLRFGHFGVTPSASALSFDSLLASEIGWAVMMAIALLPFGIFFVAPFLFFQLGKPAPWHPLPAALAGGFAGLVATGLFMLVVDPAAWRPLDTGTFVLMFGGTAFLVGGAATGAGTWLARFFPPEENSAVPREIPPPIPYDY